MQPAGSAQPVSPQSAAVDVPGRPDFVDSCVQFNLPIPATAVRWVTPERERRTTRPDTAVVYLPAPSPEMAYFGRCFAHAYITPSDAPWKANPAPFIRAAIAVALPSLRYELMPPGYGADKMVRFRTPEDREAAMARQPFPLDGASVKLVREGETSNVRRVRIDTLSLAHLELRGYPKELRSVEEIRNRCTSFGHLLEVDPACFTAPDLSPVRVVIRTESAREIPCEVRIRWGGAFRHVVPVQILRVWNASESSDANGMYVPIYGPDAVVPA
jgi:hypothetical protein